MARPRRVNQRTENFIAEVLTVDLADPKKELMRLPADLAHYDALYLDAYEAHTRAKRNCEAIKASLMRDPDLVIELRAELGKAPNIDVIKAAVLVHVDYENAKEQEITAEIQMKRALGHVDAIREKSRMLQMAVAIIRDELKADGY